ncbi:ABC transporter permease [Microbacterium sp. NPDC056044]|uniref:ABC transporter permease n=1 Tax=Microbacterium sp. NPDC056044 TaxID=3345690 RepID=UPI0035D92DBE
MAQLDMEAPPAAGLQRVGQRPALLPYLAETWRRRSFALTLAGYRLTADLLLNRLGVLWIVLKPLSVALVYGTIFHFLLSGAARPANFLQYLIVGVFVFEFFTGSFSQGAKAITGNAKLVQSLGFPRILLPVSVVAEQAMRMVPVVVLLGILLLVFGEPLAWSWLLLVPILAVMAVFNLGVALVVARMSVRTRDVQQFIPIITRILFYTSGIFFSVDGALADYPILLTAVQLIPTYDFIAISRDVMLTGYTAPAIAWVAALAWATFGILFGVVFFWRDEARYGLSD